MKHLASIFSLALIAACASNAPYGAATKSGGQGYIVQPIEADRFRVSYTDQDAAKARSRALYRAAELTREQGAEWFNVISAFDDVDTRHSGGSSVGIGAAGGSSGRTSVGVGVGISLPLGGRSGPTTHVLEIITGSGEVPDEAGIYVAEEVLLNLSEAL